ncbi:efflux RND transporter periplasmic adaptor subunit [bacterium]|nr:efflux RND transporter periplasmic adaptor subunit [bacterium]
MKRIVPIILIALAAYGGWRLVLFDESNHPQFSGFIEAEDAAVGSRTGGRVVEVFVKEGDRVQTGDLLIQLDNAPALARFEEAQAGLALAQKRLEELENGTRPQDLKRMEALYEQAKQQWTLLVNGPRLEDVRVAEANVKSTSADLLLATLTVNRQRELFAKKNTTADNLDRAEANLKIKQNQFRAASAELEKLRAGFREEEISAAKAQVDAASAALELAMEGPRKETIEQARADLDRTKALVDAAKIDVAEAEIKASTDAVVEVCRIQPGDLLAPNQTAAVLLLHVPMWVRVYVPESRLGSVAIGDALDLSVASYPDKKFRGRVVQVNRKAEFTPRNVQTEQTRDDLVFGVKIEIDDPDDMLRPGMVADVAISSYESNGE